MNGLVLSGGGARAAYQVGVLSCVAERASDVDFSIITGVSAGAINAAFLAGSQDSGPLVLEQLAEAWRSLTIDQVFDAKIGALGLSGARWLSTLVTGASNKVKTRGLLDTAPLGEFLERCLDVEGIARNIDAGRLRALALTTTRYSTGQTVTFVHGPENIPTWNRARRSGVRTKTTVDHVMASSALPLIFPAIDVDGEYYGDGSIRQAAPLAPAVHLGADRLLAIATRYGATLAEVRERATAGYPPPAQVIGLLFNTIFLDTLEQDAERLQRLNDVLDALPYGIPNPGGLRRVRLHVIRPTRDLGVLAIGYRNKLPRALRLLLRGMGVERVRSGDLLSYLIFEEPYVSQLIELGYDDTRARWDEFERFFADDS
jgi:NTE family protein